ncbi:hypothetical protein SASPL_134899 [Salvia splendens]|uniref:Uncharacterized protein n=1 Tax=Salvia splendens TaxID=180675 RepID=A0A8X8WYL0_SALSN|nr:hypothetical protein SASPL_134899 [Salvia splendens]
MYVQHNHQERGNFGGRGASHGRGRGKETTTMKNNNQLKLNKIGVAEDEVVVEVTEVVEEATVHTVLMLIATIAANTDTMHEIVDLRDRSSAMCCVCAKSMSSSKVDRSDTSGSLERNKTNSVTSQDIR